MSECKTQIYEMDQKRNTNLWANQLVMAILLFARLRAGGRGGKLLSTPKFATASSKEWNGNDESSPGKDQGLAC